jgi:hypothetical protein
MGVACGGGNGGGPFDHAALIKCTMGRFPHKRFLGNTRVDSFTPHPYRLKARRDPTLMSIGNAIIRR